MSKKTKPFVQAEERKVMSDKERDTAIKKLKRILKKARQFSQKELDTFFKGLSKKKQAELKRIAKTGKVDLHILIPIALVGHKKGEKA